MKEKIIYKITNPEYRFSSNGLNFEGYLIVSEKEGKAVINHFGEHVMPHEDAIKWYKEKKLSPLKVYVEGDIIKLIQIKDDFNRKPIGKVLKNLESELLGAQNQ